MKINLYFDFDNTLGHRKNGMWSYSLLSILKKEGINHINLEDISALMHQKRFSWNYPEISHEELFNGLTWWEYHNESMRNILLELGIDNVRADFLSNKMKDEYLILSEWELYDNTIEILKKSKELGYNNYIISNHVPELRELLTDLNVFKYFAGLFNSGELGFEKPNKKIYQYALNNSKESDVNIMIGDNYNADILGSLELGFKAIFVRKPNLNNYKYYTEYMDNLFDIIDELILLIQ